MSTYCIESSKKLEYKNREQRVDYLCMHPDCSAKCTKRIQSLLYNVSGNLSKKHDYSILLTDKLVPFLCCPTCNTIIAKTKKDSILFKDTHYIHKVYRNITKENSTPRDYELYKKFIKVQNIVTIESNIKIPYLLIQKDTNHKSFQWRMIKNVCSDISYKTIIEKQILYHMYHNTINRRRDAIHSQPIQLPNKDETTIIKIAVRRFKDSHGKERQTISFLDKNGKKCIGKLNQNKQFEYDGTTYQLIGDASIDEDDDRDIEAYLEENGINHRNLRLHAFDQLEKQMNDDGKLVCYITHIILNCEQGSMYYLSPERLLQDKPYLYKDEFGSIQRNFVFICQKLNGKKQMTLQKFIKLSIASYLNKIYGVTIHMCHQVEKGQIDGIPPPRLKRIQEHLHKIQEEYDECVDYLTKSRSENSK